MNPVVLIDFSNFVYACWFPALSAQKQDPKYDPHEVLKTNIDGKLTTLARTLNEEGYQDGADIYFVEDRRSERKYKLFPAYKAKRKPMEHDPRPEAKQYLLSEGFDGQFCHSPENEADDTIASFVRQCRKIYEGRDVIIASSDKDLWQLVQPGVRVWQLTKDRFVTPEMILEEFGVHQASQIPMVKALWGDSGDNVPNACPRMQKVLMPGVSDTPGDPDSFFGWFNNFSLKKEHAEKLSKAEAQVRLNYELVKLDGGCAIVLSDEELK